MAHHAVGKICLVAVLALFGALYCVAITPSVAYAVPVNQIDFEQEPGELEAGDEEAATSQDTELEDTELEDTEPGMLPDTQPLIHVVVAGESLSVIAERYGISMASLMAENGITDPDTIRIGLRLRLPADIDRPVVGVDPLYAVEEAPTEHVVLPGQTLSGIALQYGLTPAELMALNGITNPDHIVIGRRLRLTPVPETEPARAPDLPEDDAAAITEPAESEPGETEPEAIDPGESQVESPLELPVESVAGAELISTLNRRVETRPGDTLAGLALRYGVNEEALRRLNAHTLSAQALPTQGLLSPGLVLILPATRAELAVDVRPVEDAESLYHQVQQGESLGLIAQAYGLTLADLLDANRITDPNNILIGQQLQIPDPAQEAEAESSGRPMYLGRPQRGYYFYTVRPGDTLSQLAREFNTTFLAILDYNNLPDPETVYRDVELRIPFGPPPLPVVNPPSPQSGTRFVVSLSRQQCWVFQGDRVLHQWICSTGYGEWITRTGVFAVQTKLDMAQSSYYELDMPYWLGIYDVGAAENGIHGLPIDWVTGEKIWEGLLGQPATFGCAMLADEDAATLFDLAYLGMPVYIVN